MLAVYMTMHEFHQVYCKALWLHSLFVVGVKFVGYKMLAKARWTLVQAMPKSRPTLIAMEEER